MKNNTYAAIMAGGKGERFWPLSTARNPKQLLALFGGKPLILLAAERMKGLVPPERILVITGADIAEATAKAVPFIPRANIIAEPFGRDTAAAVALAAAVVHSRDPGGVFAVLTADHVIGDTAGFRTVLGESFRLAGAEDVLVTMGITPAFPSTGFGYIEAGPVLRRNCRKGVLFRKALRFVEKPDLKTARHYLKTGRFFWNSGMFIWSCKSIEAALSSHAPNLKAMADRLALVAGSRLFKAAILREYEKLDRISIDYAVMEKARNIVMARGDFEWDDVGTWAAMENHFRPDAEGNIVLGEAEAIDSSGNVVVSRGRLTATIGVRDMIVINAGGATLVCPKSRAQDVKKIVDAIRRSGKHPELL